MSQNGTIMPALCSMLHLLYYARNYAGIICQTLISKLIQKNSVSDFHNPMKQTQAHTFHLWFIYFLSCLWTKLQLELKTNVRTLFFFWEEKKILQRNEEEKKISCRAFRRKKNILPTRLLEKKKLADQKSSTPPPSKVKWSAPYLAFPAL